MFSTGATSVIACEAENTDDCWGYQEGYRLTGIFGADMALEAAKDACFDDDDCTGKFF